VSVPVRAAPLFDAMLNAAEPLPTPDAPCVIDTHGAFDVALHAQLLVVVTAVDPVPPVESTDWLAGEIE
jgi:hypothetical protein